MPSGATFQDGEGKRKAKNWKGNGIKWKGLEHP